MKALMLLAHLDIDKGSIANRLIVDAVKDRLDVRDLQALYPDFKIDIEAEQAALLAADLIIFQFPFYWYSTPGILKEWQDQVLTYGFAFGSTGNKLKNKEFLISCTIGGSEEAYQPEGYNKFRVSELLRPLEQMANLTGMKFQPPILSYGMVFIPGVYNSEEVVVKRAQKHADQLLDWLKEKLG